MNNLKTKPWLMLAAFILFHFIPFYIHSQTPLISYTQVLNLGAVAPIDIVNPYDGTNRLFIVERAGRIRIFSGSAVSPTAFLDLRSTGLISTQGEQGLLSLAFAPNYATSGYFFIYYTNAAGSIEVARYQRSALDPNEADPSSARILLTIPHPTFTNHNGGKLNFGSDGYLYFGTGDGGSSNDPSGNAQDGNELLGKMLRLNANTTTDIAPWYTIPPDNPYVGDAAVRDEILAIGLRNPFRWSFDRNGSGPWDMWIADVGQNFYEEVNYTPGGIRKLNYGWRCFEGLHDNPAVADCNPPDYEPPIFEYEHSLGNAGHSITGGLVYRGSAYPGLQGWYICIDYLNPNGWVVKPNGAGLTIFNRQGGQPVNITAYAEDLGREIYAVALNGILYRVDQSGVLPLKLKSFFVLNKNGTHEISWETSAEQNLKDFEVQSGTDGVHFTTIGKLGAVNSSAGHRYFFNHSSTQGGSVFYRLRMNDLNGNPGYSNIFKIESSIIEIVQMSSTVVENGRLEIHLLKPFTSMVVIDMNGKQRKQQQLSQHTAKVSLDVSGLSKGIYILKLSGSGNAVLKRFVVL
jgi:glucose/arabinose dehydrogenase